MQTTFVLASLAGSALAGHVLNAAPALKRDVESLQARQTGSLGDINISEECQSAGLELITSLPTPAPEIQSDALNNPQTGDPCSFSTPSSLSSEYASYSSELMSWYEANSAAVESAFSACSDIASLGADFVKDVCTDDLNMVGTPTAGGSMQTPPAGGNGGSGSGSGSGSDDDEDEDDDAATTGGAPRETGVAMAAIAAGLFAAVF